MLNLSCHNHQPLLTAALSYAILGIPVFPIHPGQKAPPLVNFTAAATTDFDQIQHWWTQWPEANIGLAMGGEWVALDLDEKPDRGESGWQSYLALGGPESPPWPVQETPGGGKHLLWQPRDAGELRNFVGAGPRRGMDMRCSNGYILGAPSRVAEGSYQWSDGDPSAPIPSSLLHACLDASRRSRERSQEAFPMPEPTELSEQEIAARIASLGREHADFLRGNGGVLGDESRDAFRVCCRAFSMGWTLGDMAAIGPQTYLAQFGRNPPHNAADPWDWCWRYTVRAAWVEQRKAGEGAPATRGAYNEENTGEATTTTPAEPEDTNTYSLMQQRAEALEPDNWVKTKAFLDQVFGAGLPASDRLNLIETVKRYARVSKQQIQTYLGELQEARDKRHREKVREAAQEIPPVYVLSQARILVRTSGTLMGREAFLTEKARDFGGDKQAAEEHWLTGSTARCETVEQVTYDPGLPTGIATRQDGARVYNTYAPSLLMPRGLGKREEVRLWFDLLEALELEGGGEVVDLLLDRLAWVVQHPGRKINHGILLGSAAKGIGKDSFLAPVLDAVGRRNVRVADGQELLASFNSYLSGTKLLVLNEIDFGGHRDRRAVSEKLKPMLAAPPDSLVVNEKNLRPYSIPNLVQIIGMTNHRYCMHLEPGDRRWLPIWCNAVFDPAARDAWVKWFNRYWEWLENGGSSYVLSYLRARDLSHFQPGARPPVTDWAEDLMHASRDGIEIWLTEQISAGEGIFARDTVKIEDVLDVIKAGAGSHWLGNQVPTLVDLGKALRNVGAMPRKLGYRRNRYWIIRSGEISGAVAARSSAAHRIIERKRKVGLPKTLPEWF